MRPEAIAYRSFSSVHSMNRTTKIRNIPKTAKNNGYFILNLNKKLNTSQKDVIQAVKYSDKYITLVAIDMG